MAGSLLSGGDQDEAVLADINVTPLVDVMLVLLIIFMITAPMLHQGVEVALPEVEADTLPQRVDDPIIVSINRDGIIYVQEEPIHPTQLVERLKPILDNRGDDSLYLKGDKELPYGTVMEVLDVLHQGGIRNVGLVTQRPRR